MIAEDQVQDFEAVVTTSQAQVQAAASAKDTEIAQLQQRIEYLESATEVNKASGLGAVLKQNDTLTKQLQLMTLEIESVMQKRPIERLKDDDGHDSDEDY